MFWKIYEEKVNGEWFMWGDILKMKLELLFRIIKQ